MEFLFPDWLHAPSNVGALSTLRRGGCSRPPYDDGQGGGGLNLATHVGDLPQDVERNRALLRHHLPADPTWLSQVHGSTVIDAADATGVPEADASIATRAGVVCAIMTADCLPVLFCDRAGRVVAAAHAGWRGLAAGVLELTVARMRAAGGGDIMAWMGPAIGAQRFEVGEDVWEAFAGRDARLAAAFQAVEGKAGKYLADIYRLARAALERAGVTEVSGGGWCTVNDAERFYSYRRDGVTGRMASLIWLK